MNPPEESPTTTHEPREPRTTRARTVALLAVLTLLLVTPTTAALTSINVANTDPQDISTAYTTPTADTYVYTFSNPPFSFNTDATNISGFAVEGKLDWGSIARTSPIRHAIWNYTISNQTQTHYIEFENNVDQNLGFWRTSIIATIDGVPTYQLREYGTQGFHPFGVEYRTSFILGMSTGTVLRSWTIGNQASVGDGAGNFCGVADPEFSEAGACGPHPELRARLATTSYNYTSAIFIAAPGGGAHAFNAAKPGWGASDNPWWFALNLTAPTSLSVTTTYDGDRGPDSAGFVYAFCQNCTSIAAKNAGGLACDGFFTGLIFGWFGFCPNINGIATYTASFVASLITFPLALVGSGDGNVAGTAATGISQFVTSIVSAYTFTLALILTSPIKLTTVTIGLISSYSALTAGIQGDPRIAARGTMLGVKWYGMVIIGYFIVLFYLAKAIVKLVMAIVHLIAKLISTARSFFQLV